MFTHLSQDRSQGVIGVTCRLHGRSHAGHMQATWQDTWQVTCRSHGKLHGKLHAGYRQVTCRLHGKSHAGHMQITWQVAWQVHCKLASYQGCVVGEKRPGRLHGRAQSFLLYFCKIVTFTWLIHMELYTARYSEIVYIQSQKRATTK